MYRLFGAGKVPKQAMSILETEGIVYQEEGIPGSIGFRNFRSPGRRGGYRRNWFSGSIVLTKLHFLAFGGRQTMIGIPWDNEKLGALSCTIDEKSRLRIAVADRHSVRRLADNIAALYRDLRGDG
jgi:hypothetical protein